MLPVPLPVFFFDNTQIRIRHHPHILKGAVGPLDVTDGKAHAITLESRSYFSLLIPATMCNAMPRNQLIHFLSDLDTLVFLLLGLAFGSLYVEFLVPAVIARDVCLLLRWG